MGSLQAAEMANAIKNDEVTERQAIVWHLRSNCFPPVPLVMVDVALAAIHAIDAEEPDESIALPDGVEFRGSDEVMPWQVIESLHLHVFLSPIDPY